MSSQDELDLLDRVLLRLAIAEGDVQMENALGKFLAPVLLKLGSTHASVRAKVMEVLTHINKRVKGQPTIKLPTEVLLLQLLDTNLSPFVHNFTLIYFEMGFLRMNQADQLTKVPELIRILPQRPAAQQIILLRLLTPLVGLVTIPQDRDERKTILGLDQIPTTRLLLVRHLEAVLLCDYNSHLLLKVASTKGSEANDSVVIPGGMSKNSLRRVTKEGSQGVTYGLKVGVVNFLSSNAFPANEVLCALVVAAADTHHSVVSAAEDGLKRITGLDLENEVLIKHVYDLIQGTTVLPGRKDDTPAEDRYRPVAGKAKQLLVGYLVKSTKATNMFPGIIQVMFDCLFGPSTNNKQRILGLQLMQSACERSQDHLMKATGTVLLQGLLNMLTKAQGEGPENAQLRSMVYLILGKLSKRQPQLFKKDLAVITLLFDALEAEDSNMRFSILEPIQMICTCYKECTGDIETKLDQLLVKAVQSSHSAVRLVAIQCTLSIFPLNHVPSRYICLLGVGDGQDDIRQEARRGLRRQHINEQPHLGAKPDPSLTPFPEMVSYLVVKSAQHFQDPSLRYQSEAGSLAFTPSVFIAVLAFLSKVLAASAAVPYPEAEEKEESEEAGNVRKEAIRTYLRSVPAPASLPAEAPNPLDEDVNAMIVTPSGNLLDDYRTLLEHALGPCAPSSLQKEAARGLEELVEALPEATAPRYTGRLAWLKGFVSSSDEGLRMHMCSVLGLVGNQTNQEQVSSLLTGLSANLHPDSTRKIRIESQLGSLCALGCVVSQCLTSERHKGLPAVQQGVQDVARCLDLSRLDLYMKACDALGQMGEKAILPLEAGPKVEYGVDITIDGEAVGSKMPETQLTRAHIVGQLLYCIKKAKEMKMTEAAVTTLGRLGLRDPALPSLEAVLAALYATQREKSPDLHFSVGLALARIGSHTGTITNIDSTEDSFTPTSTMGSILSEVLGLVTSPAPPVRQAACVWLMSLVKFNPHHPIIQERLHNVQQGLTIFLGDADEFTQECASNGLGLVYECGSEEMKKDLVDALVSTLTSGTKQQKVSAESQLFTQDMGTTPAGGTLNTYRDLCGLVSELNKPDLIYKFMALSHHNALWNSRKGAAFGFSSIANLAEDQLIPYLPGLVPRLFRYKRDPNPKTRQAMSEIWKALHLDSGNTVKKFAKEIVADLQKNMISNQWRTREASCLALSEYLNVMQLDLPMDTFETLWVLCFRMLDDVKESVRNAAAITSHSIANITKKMCDPTITTNQDTVRRVLNTAMPILLEKGLKSDVKEVQGLSLQTMQQICKVAGAQVRPYISDVVVVMLQGQSELESASINYLSFHLDKYQVDRELFEDARVAASKTSPMAETIDLIIRQVDDTVLSTLVPRLLDLVRGIGLQTRVGAARVLASLVDPQRGLNLTKYTARILKTLQGCLTDPSPAIRKSCSASVSYVVKAAGDTEMDRFLANLQDMALNTDDDAQHHISAYTCQQISHHSGDSFKRFSAKILPLAFVAMHANGEAKDIWEVVWEENTPGTKAGQRLYQTEIVDLIVPLLAASSWSQKKTGATAARRLSEGVGAYLAPQAHRLLAPLVGGLAGRTWDGKEALLQATASVVAACIATLPKEGKVGLDGIVTVLLKESGRKQLAYKQQAVTALGTVLKAEHV
eukprot:Ihof_evm1s534 gene=Ihof_evmTU1s534